MVTDPEPGKETNMRKFTRFRHGESIIFDVKKDASPELYRLAEQFPRAVANALFMLGGHVRKAMHEHIDKGGGTAGKWLQLSDLHKTRAFNRLKSGELRPPAGTPGAYRGIKKKNAAGRWTAPGLIDRTKKTQSKLGLYGKVRQTIAFKQTGLRVVIGALSPSGENFLSAVQDGRWGPKGFFRNSGVQRVTPAMRRALWAAGFPISAETTVIGHEPRPLVPPVYAKMRPEFERYIMQRTMQYLEGKGKRVNR